MEHYASVVGMLGSGGYLDEAMDFIQNMPYEPSVDVWETLMNFCRVHGNVQLGDYCAEVVNHLDPCRLSGNSKVGLVPGECADSGEWPKLDQLLAKCRPRENFEGYVPHPDKDKLVPVLKSLSISMKEEFGYVQQERYGCDNVEPENREEAVLVHTEKLALASILVSSPPRAPVYIHLVTGFLCPDCHNAFQIISKLLGREISVRCKDCLHRFKDGLCICHGFCISDI